MKPLQYETRDRAEPCCNLALGCSHTWGVGVDADQAWPARLGALNLGVGGVSSDFVVRMARTWLDMCQPQTVYCLWPDWSRFEYWHDNEWYQSLPTDSHRINFMLTHDEAWCKANFVTNTQALRHMCDARHVRLIDLTLYDLIPYIDHADRWPVSRLGHHYAPEWHAWVADIFQQQTQTLTRTLRND